MPATAVEPIEAQLGRRTALLTTVIAVIASIITGVISSKLTSLQSQEDFTRSQRQVAYAAFISDSTAVDSALDRVRNIMGEIDRDKSVARACPAAIEAYRSAHDKVSVDLSNIEIIGSQTMTSLMSEYRDWYTLDSSLVNVAADVCQNGAGWLVDRAVNGSDLYPEMYTTKMQKASGATAFRDYARADLNR